MLDESLKKIDEISRELGNHYNASEAFYKTLEDNSKILEKLRDSKHQDPAVQLLAALAVVSEIRSRAIHTSYLSTLNKLTRLSLLMQISTIAIANELSQLKQQSSTPPTEANIEKISEIEKEITKLNKEFSKYSPTLKKFKRALDQTEKTLRDNR